MTKWSPRLLIRLGCIDPRWRFNHWCGIALGTFARHFNFGHFFDDFIHFVGQQVLQWLQNTFLLQLRQSLSLQGDCVDAQMSGQQIGRENVLDASLNARHQFVCKGTAEFHEIISFFGTQCLLLLTIEYRDIAGDLYQRLLQQSGDVADQGNRCAMLELVQHRQNAVAVWGQRVEIEQHFWWR